MRDDEGLLPIEPASKRGYPPNPYPYPLKPVPVAAGMGLSGYRSVL